MEILIKVQGFRFDVSVQELIFFKIIQVGDQIPGLISGAMDSAITNSISI